MTENKSPEGMPERAPLKQAGQPQGRPASSFSFAVGLCGAATFLVAIFTIRHIPRIYLFFTPAQLALTVMILTALGVFIPDIFWKKSHLRVYGGAPRAPSPSWPRTMTKVVGLLGSIGFVGLLYWLFPEYKASFYDPYFAMLSKVLPVWLLLSIPYIFWVDARMAKPEDALWYMGRTLMLQGDNLELRRIVQHLLGWLIKGFFLPLMFVYLSQAVSRFMSVKLEDLYGFKSFFGFSYDLMIFLDLAICACGYLFTLRLTNTHIRSADSTLVGWLVVFICFEPFWSLINRQYLAYESRYWWGNWLQSSPTFFTIWGSLILILTLIYLSATVAFGMRYSNLTHRGILTSGPYRWSKHPAYVSQNISFWLISVPFIAHSGIPESLRHMALLLGVNAIYYLRAKTEERHLSRDPVYVQYAQWIDRHGLFAIVRRWFKAMQEAPASAEKRD